METQEWVARCAARLHERWRHVPDDQLREVAAEIQRNAWRQIAESEHAAVEWLRHGIADTARDAH